MINVADRPLLEQLEHIRSAVDDLSANVRRATRRVDNIERLVTNLRVSKEARVQELAKINERLERIERRLELVD